MQNTKDKETHRVYIYFVLVVGLFEGYDGMLWIIMNNILYSVFFFCLTVVCARITGVKQRYFCNAKQGNVC